MSANPTPILIQYDQAKAYTEDVAGMIYAPDENGEQVVGSYLIVTTDILPIPKGWVMDND